MKDAVKRRKISLLKDELGKEFEEKMIELVDIPYWWRHFKNGILWACYEVCV